MSEVRNKPLVSIVMPTFNRADTIRRAIASIQAQAVHDWELIVVDDGSTDDTAALIAGMDPRLKIIRQENRGSAVARNTGLRQSTGKYIAFLDSDDEWLPHHLELCLAFLRAHPEEAFVTTIFLEDLGQGRFVNHPGIEISEWHPSLAKRIGSHMLDLPAGETDPYLRVYPSRQPIGEWGQQIVARTPYREVFHYSGRIFEHFRWGFLMGLPPTVMTREAFEATGFFDTGYYIASDFGYTAQLGRHFRTNFLSIPSYIKHELAPAGNKLGEDHLAKGKTQPEFNKDMLRWIEELFWNGRPQDRELSELRSHKQFYLAKTDLIHGLRDEALRSLDEAMNNSPERWQVLSLKLFVKLIPDPELCQRAFVTMFKVSYTWELFLRREITIGGIIRKSLKHLLTAIHDLRHSSRKRVEQGSALTPQRIRKSR